MQYIGSCLNFTFLPVASNDNDDLLSLPFPALELSIIREIKRELCLENQQSGILLRSRRERRFFQEVTDAERYIVLRYFTHGACEQVLRELKRHIVSTYLFPRKRRSRKKG